MIKSIEMTNVKGQTAVQELTGKDIIIGRNGAGKTTRMQSVGLAMLGYVPGKGKTTADTFKLASADEMKVLMETDNFTFERAFVKTRKLKTDGTPDVKISQKLSVSPSKGETTNTQKEQRIKQEMGDIPVMLDFGSFIAMTDNQQRDFIYSLSGNGFTWDRARVEKEMIATLLTPEMEVNNRELFYHMAECIDETMKQYGEGIDVQAGILAMSEYAKDKLKYWKKEKINADGAAKKLTELKNRGEETDRDLLVNMEKMKELQAQKEKTIKDLAELSAKNKIRADKEQELKKLQEEIVKLSETSVADRATFLEEAIDILKAELIVMEMEEQKNSEKASMLQNKLASLQDQLKREQDVVLAAKEELATINAMIKANSDLLQRIADSHGCCAFSPNIPCNQDFSAFINETQDCVDEAYDHKDKQVHIIEAANAVIEYLKEQDRLTQAEQKKLEEDRKSRARTVTAKQKEIEQKKSELLELRSREPMLEVKRKQEAEIVAYLDENQKVDLTAMEDQKTLLEGQIQSLTATIDKQKKIRNDLMNIKANIIDSQTAEFAVLCWSQITNAIGQKGIKGNLMKEMLNPLLEDVNVKLHAIGITEDFFFETNSETGKEIFEFGWGTKPFEALSTGEQLLLMTALMTTMIEKADPPVKVLAIDDINNLDGDNQKKIISGVTKIAANMDNIIFAGVSDIKEVDAPGWKIWRI